MASSQSSLNVDGQAETKRLHSGFLAAAGLIVLFASGCNVTHNSEQFTTPPSTTTLSGNWAFTAPAVQGAPGPLTLNVGFTQGTGETVTGVAHLTGTSCVSSTTGIALTGAIAANNQLTLTSAPFGGSTLSITGQLAATGKAITNPAWSFSGGSCAALGAAQIQAQNYADIAGSYTGTFVDSGNNQLAVTATLTQTTQPDGNGQFQLSGSATFPNNPCFTQSIVTSSDVTGSSLSTTYTDSTSGATITAVGTFNGDATQLTVTNWQVSGGLCDGDSGTGLLTAPI